MRADYRVADGTERKNRLKEQLEASWRQAWDARSRAAQCGDYATAERWHRRAVLLGLRLAANDRATCEGR